MIKKALSKTQIDRLGDRLKGGPHTERDLRLLDDYRRSFDEAYGTVVRTLRQLGEDPTGRLAKSTVSIADKLRRESIRLSQMQDIAGCRIVVESVVEQKQLVASLMTDLPGASLIDRRDHHSHGYRAAHVIAEISGKPVEIQVRTSLQHLWAEVSEKSSDVIDPTIKYGGGPDGWRDFLAKSSESVASYEDFEEKNAVAVATHEKYMNAFAELPERHILDHELQEVRRKREDLRRRMLEMDEDKERLRNNVAGLLVGAISWLEERKGEK